MRAGSVRLSRWYILPFLIELYAFRPAFAIDPFQTSRDVGPLVPNGILAKTDVCRPAVIGDPLLLAEAVERALCGNPKTLQAWANVKVEAAAVGIARAAFLPTLAGSAQDVRDRSSTEIIQQRSLDTSQAALQHSEYLSLNWVLFDFGARNAALDGAVALLGAAQANQQAVLQNTFVTVAKDYYGAQSAQGALRVSEEIENVATESLKAATQRVTYGVAAISDQLQAQTSLAQASLNRVKANGDLQLAMGVLASDMALSPSTPLHLPDIIEQSEHLRDFDEAVDQLIDEARHLHPDVLAAARQVEAADAKTKQVERDGLPSISLVGRGSRTNQRYSPGFGENPLPSIGKDAYMGFQLSFQLFDGFSRVYQSRQAEAQAELARVALSDVDQKVSLDVWSNYQLLKTASENLKNSETLADVAGRGYSASRARYLSGAGSILELLSAQSALANAGRQRILLLSDWHIARLQLAGALGRLGTWNESFTR